MQGNYVQSWTLESKSSKVDKFQVKTNNRVWCGHGSQVLQWRGVKATVEVQELRIGVAEHCNPH